MRWRCKSVCPFRRYKSAWGGSPLGRILKYNLFCLKTITMNRRPNKKALKARVRKTINKNDQNLRNISARNRARIRLLGGSRKPTRLRAGRSTQMSLPKTVRYMAPQQTTRMNSTRIKHREPLGVLLGSANFTVTTFNINPGLAATFPWMAPQANGYESYCFNSIHIEYDHTINEFTGLGRIVMAPDYDASDSPPTSMIQAEQFVDNVMGAVTRDWTCTLKPRGTGIIGPQRYTRPGGLSANEDIKLYDVAQVYVCTSGQANNAEIGQLWIVYDVTLKNPQAIPPINSGSLINPTGGGSLTTNILGTGPFVSQGALTISNLLNVVTVTNLIIGQNYMVYIHLVASTLTTSTTVTYTSGGTVLNAAADFYNAGAKVFVIGTTEQAVISAFTATLTTAVLTLGGLSVDTVPTRDSIYIMGVNFNITS
jgi:hypothetical protein